LEPASAFALGICRFCKFFLGKHSIYFVIELRKLERVLPAWSLSSIAHARSLVLDEPERQEKVVEL
jgi:hypothetical protein